MFKINKSFFKKYSLLTLLFTLLTVFWGAWVRLSISGHACGQSWPLCNEKFLPSNTKALIEWIHRLSSGLSFLLVLFLFIISLKIYNKKHMVQKISLSCLILIFIEALIGALLVLGEFVALNKDSLRVFILAFHLINSLLLIGALSLCWKVSLWNHLTIKKPVIYFVVVFPLLALTGNIASLAGQLFPSSSLSHALALDFLPSAHLSLKIRPLHPLIAILFSISLLILAFSKKHLKIISLFSLLVLSFGFLTLLSLSPLWMKITHLIMAYCLWILFVINSVKKIHKA